MHHYFALVSTNALALGLGSRRGSEGGVFLAENRPGRSAARPHLHSARADAIYGSVLLRPQLPPPRFCFSPWAAALAVRSAF